MKRVLTIFVALVAVVVMASCSYKSSPESVVERYVESLQAGKYNRIFKLFYFESSAERAEKKEALMTAFETKIEPRVQAKGGVTSYTLNEVRVDKDGLTAYVELTIEYGNGSAVTQDTEVMNKDGKWYLPAGSR